MIIDRGLLSLLLIGLTAVAAEPKVRIAGGELQGHIVNGVHAYEGIPYAEQPKRLEKPVKKAAWTGVKEVTKAPLPCVQFVWGGGKSTEDCLVLTVVAPEKTATKYPVVVVVHGGAFAVGGIFETNVTEVADNFVKKGVVVVAVQYRLGALGFCSTGDATMPGNYGLFDLKMAFEWVRDNIAAFGGDPKAVTAYGGSAGAGMIGSLLLNAEAEKLFHKMYVYSGATRDQFKQDIKGSCKKILGEKGLDVSTPAKMRAAIVAETNLAKFEGGWQLFFEDSIENFAINWGPVADGDFFKGDVSAARAAAASRPMVVGVADLEGAGFVGHFKDTIEDWKADWDRIIKVLLPETMPNRSSLNVELMVEVGKYVERRMPGINRLNGSRAAVGQIYGEKSMVSVVLDEIEYFFKKNGDAAPVYLYNFKWFNKEIAALKRANGAFHAMEQWYALNSANIEYARNEVDRKVRTLYTNTIVNFAKTGDPNGAGSTKLAVPWEKLTKDHATRNYQIDEKPAMREDYFDGRPKRILEWLRAAGKTTAL